ncbi:MAG TPA: hypothetical protein VII60_04015 [Acidimicrobiales bacterium]
MANTATGWPGQSTTTLHWVQVRLTGRVESAGVLFGIEQLTCACTTPTYAYTTPIDRRHK